MSVIKFKQHNDAVDVLEKALERAKDGEFSSVSVVWVCPNEGKASIGGSYSKTNDCFLMYSSIKYAERHYAELTFGHPIEG